MFGLGGGMGGMPQPTPEQIEALQKQMGGKLPDFPGGAGGLPPLPPGSPARAVPACRASADRSCRAFPASASRSEARRNEFCVPAAALAAAVAYPSSIARTG